MSDNDLRWLLDLWEWAKVMETRAYHRVITDPDDPTKILVPLPKRFQKDENAQ